jgi:hypothetical protein
MLVTRRMITLPITTTATTAKTATTNLIITKYLNGERYVVIT